MESKVQFKDIDHYISLQPETIRITLEKLRQTIRKAAPKAEELISYRMPAYRHYGMLVFFAVFKKHIGFYPGTAAIIEFKKELLAYKGAKGSVQFPIDKPLPFGLVSRIVKFKVKENELRKKKK